MQIYGYFTFTSTIVDELKGIFFVYYLMFFSSNIAWVTNYRCQNISL